jgi:hypothetical protein
MLSRGSEIGERRRRGLAWTLRALLRKRRKRKRRSGEAPEDADVLLLLLLLRDGLRAWFLACLSAVVSHY